ncbi:outer membrane lipoprotein chaperone LolA [Candidatus Gillettellia adelgis]
MKKLLIEFCILFGLTSISVLAGAKQDLQYRLTKLDSFYARFSQTITNSDGITVQQGEGELWAKRPNLFNWHMISPDNNMLISDGQTLWFYNPYIAQVTASWLKDSVNNTPFILILRYNSNEWNQYQVTQQGDNFQLTPKSRHTNLKQFIINVSKYGTIRNLVTVEQDGQCNKYILKNQHDISGGLTKFIFTPPQGVTLDDQRK